MTIIHLQSHVHYHFRRLVGMEAVLKKGVADPINVGLLPEGDWPVALPNKRTTIRVELEDGDRRRFWRPEWKDIKDESV